VIEARRLAAVEIAHLAIARVTAPTVRRNVYGFRKTIEGRSLAEVSRSGAVV